MSQEQIQLLDTKNIEWNQTSDFKIKFYKTGTFFEMANSNGKVHDLSFQSILQSLKDIRDNFQAKQFILDSTQNPHNVTNDPVVEKARFDAIIATGPVQCTIWRYFEKVVRVLGSEVLTHARAKVVAQEQSKLFFNAMSRFVHIANNIAPDNLDIKIPFSDNEINRTIKFIEDVITSFTLAKEMGEIKFNLEKNTIFLGAPGTGKSYEIEQYTKQAITVRTVFHPDMQYSDFVGCLRPRMVTIGESRVVSYEFRPGAFTKSYIQALNNPTQHVYLIIEEINRAPAAAVFGDLFQILDQDSAYEIDIDPDMLDYINAHIPARVQKLSMPPNLTILATMNSSDQGVNSLDTAFKRRWAINYLPIDYTKATPGSLSLPIQGSIYNIEWSCFAKIINEQLMSLGVPEDRLLGHRFLSVSDLASAHSALDALRYKLFVYLWDDVLRHGKRQSIFSTETAGNRIGTFGQLVRVFSEGKSVFVSDIEEFIKNEGMLQLAQLAEPAEPAEPAEIE